MNKVSYEELIAFHPGYYVREIIENQEMTQDELAKRLQTSGKYVSDLLNGRINLTDEMALKLSIVFGTSTELWLNLNKSYIEKKLEIERRIKVEEECKLIQEVDYSFWTDLGLVESVKRATDKVKELQKYLRVASLGVLVQKDFLVQYNKSMESEVNIFNANAWVQTAINIGREMKVQPFDKKKLTITLPQIRKIIGQSREEYLPQLTDILGECGVAFMVLPNLKNCGINGVVKWINKEKVIVAINSRCNTPDDFGYALFHELGHVQQQRLKVLMVSEENQRIEMDEFMQRLEKEADEFAEKMMMEKEK